MRPMAAQAHLPFDAADPQARRAWLQMRLSGTTTPPLVDLAGGEMPWDLVAHWIRDDVGGCGDTLEGDVAELLSAGLADAGDQGATPEQRRLLGGLLCLARAVASEQVAGVVRDLVWDDDEAALREVWFDLRHLDCGWGWLGRLLLDVLDATGGPEVLPLFHAAIEAATTPGDRAHLLLGVAARDPDRAERLGLDIVGAALGDQDVAAAREVLAVLQECCWDVQDEGASLDAVVEGLWDLAGDPDLRPAAAHLVEVSFPAPYGRFGALQIRTYRRDRQGLPREGWGWVPLSAGGSTGGRGRTS